MWRLANSLKNMKFNSPLRKTHSEFWVNCYATTIILFFLVLTLCVIRLWEFLLFFILGITYATLSPVVVGTALLAVVFWGFVTISIWMDD